MPVDMLRFRLAYLATPYSKYCKGIDVAFEHAAALAAKLLIKGVKVFSPITLTHPMAIYGHIDPLDHKIWIPFDETMMRMADALIVAMMDGWRESFGIAHEIRYFTGDNKPVVYLDPETLIAQSEVPA